MEIGFEDSHFVSFDWEIFGHWKKKTRRIRLEATELDTATFSNLASKRKFFFEEFNSNGFFSLWFGAGSRNSSTDNRGAEFNELHRNEVTLFFRAPLMRRLIDNTLAGQKKKSQHIALDEKRKMKQHWLFSKINHTIVIHTRLSPKTHLGWRVVLKTNVIIDHWLLTIDTHCKIFNENEWYLTRSYYSS